MPLEITQRVSDAGMHWRGEWHNIFVSFDRRDGEIQYRFVRTSILTKHCKTRLRILEL